MTDDSEVRVPLAVAHIVVDDEHFAERELIRIRLTRDVTPIEAGKLTQHDFLAHPTGDDLYFAGSIEALEDLAPHLNQILAEMEEAAAAREAQIIREEAEARARLEAVAFPLPDDPGTLLAIRVNVEATMALASGDSISLVMSRSLTPTEIELARDLQDLSAYDSGWDDSTVRFEGRIEDLEDAAPNLNALFAELERKAREVDAEAEAKVDKRRQRLSKIEFPPAKGS